MPLKVVSTDAPLTIENFIGFAENDCTDNGLATIQLGGSVNDKQTSLTAGQTYFVQTDGTIGTTADSLCHSRHSSFSNRDISEGIKHENHYRKLNQVVQVFV